MSTEHQQYSPENQLEVVRQYAATRNMEIVQEYSDHGRSGLNITGREGLNQLMADVEAKRTTFTSLLVYCVSRWRRFQNVDDSAYYECVLKRAGTRVHYCAEQFENDGSMSSSVLKTLKRSMAAEYSRELSVKVFSGQCRFIELGFRQGGPAGYGLRRQLIDRDQAPNGRRVRESNLAGLQRCEIRSQGGRCRGDGRYAGPLQECKIALPCPRVLTERVVCGARGYRKPKCSNDAAVERT